ncbi:MAG TPA: xanthine dehydrogenase family protein molybdopterin-binding subunit, partial [Symbiobacteriaceae bacterium]|nr:xanthine dehydrogenase family protein molybdopterin-binding subunit [Symbiobacteriaceae bacterium]
MSIGQRLLRNEDPRLLRGQGLFVDDVRHPDMLHGAVVRSPHAHARIRQIDVSKAAALPGVELVLLAEDLGKLNGPLPLLIPHDDLQYGRTQSALAQGKVRHIGEAVAFVVARDRYIAEDAADLVEVAYEPLPVAADLEAAARPGAPRVHDDTPDNIGGHYVR